MAKKQTQEAGNSPASLKEIASAFFDANPSYSSIIVTEDGAVFEDSQLGYNAATNHANASNPKLNFETFKR